MIYDYIHISSINYNYLLQNKYPWLSNPEYNMLSIQEEIKKLYHLQDEVDKLKSKTECYCDLSPDMLIAKNQLSKIKIEYEKISKMVLEKESL